MRYGFDKSTTNAYRLVMVVLGLACIIGVSLGFWLIFNVSHSVIAGVADRGVLPQVAVPAVTVVSVTVLAGFMLGAIILLVRTAGGVDRAGITNNQLEEKGPMTNRPKQDDDNKVPLDKASHAMAKVLEQADAEGRILMTEPCDSCNTSETYAITLMDVGGAGLLDLVICINGHVDWYIDEEE